MNEEEKESTWGVIIFMVALAIIIGLFTYSASVKNSNKDEAMDICVQNAPYVECYEVIHRVRPRISTW